MHLTGTRHAVYTFMARASLRRRCQGQSHSHNTRHNHRRRIVEQYLKNTTQRYTTIAREVGVDKHTAKRTVQRWNEEGTYETKRTGPKVGSHFRGMANAIHKGILTMIGRHGLSAKSAAVKVGLSPRTMRRAAKAAGIDYASGPRQTSLTEAQVADRLRFARRYPKAHNNISWRRGLFVDATPCYMALTHGKHAMSKEWNFKGAHPPATVEAHPRG